MFRIFLFCINLFSSCCSSESTDSLLVKNHTMRVSQADTTKSKTLGTYNKNEITVPIKDYVAIWIEDKNVLKVIQTPTILTAEERNRLKGGKTEFFVLVNKETPNNKIWKWYPYVVT